MAAMLVHVERPTRIVPGPGQESVWDYPRPPRLEPTGEHVVVRLAGAVVADTRAAFRVLETSQAPAYYLPPGDVRSELLTPSDRRSFCEWKGTASYFDVTVGDVVARAAAWSYPEPTRPFAPIAGYLSFYPQLVDCFVDGEQVGPMPGGFYGGWVTSRVVGPFKGAPGTGSW
jgi:uncharacterized protein (DUF427 family)